MKLTYSQAWHKMRRAGFLPVQTLNSFGNGAGFFVREEDSIGGIEIKHDEKGFFVAEHLEAFIKMKREGVMLRTYRAKFEGDPQDDNAYEAFNAENLDVAVKLANKRWPAGEDELDISEEHMQLFTNDGWVWAKDYNEN